MLARSLPAPAEHGQVSSSISTVDSGIARFLAVSLRILLRRTRTEMPRFMFHS